MLERGFALDLGKVLELTTMRDLFREAVRRNYVERV